MGRTALSSYEDVAQACEALAASNALSVDNLRARLGGGSKGYLLGQYQKWLAARRAAAVPLEQLFSEAMRQAWIAELERHKALVQEEAAAQRADLESQLRYAQEGLGQAEARIEAQHAQLEAAAAEALAVAAAASATRQRLENDVGAAQLQVRGFAERIERLSENLARQAQEIEVARRAGQNAELLSTTLQTRLDVLTAQHEQLQAALVASHETQAVADRRAAVAEERARGRDDMLQARERDLAAALGLAEEGRAWQRRLMEAIEKIGVVERREAVANAERLALEHRLEGAVAELSAARGERGALEEAQTQLRVLERERARRLRRARARPVPTPG